MKLKKFEGNPILSPLDSNDWESLVTCNPGVVYDNGTFYMLYRAAGNDVEHVIRLSWPPVKTDSTLSVYPMFRCSAPVRTVLIRVVWKIPAL